MPWLLDTNILSELRRQRPEPLVTTFVSDRSLDQLYINTVTAAEIRFGIFLADPARRQELNRWFSDEIRPMFSGRILEISEDVIFRWRLLVDDGRKIGRTYSQPDLILAATALEHRLTLVTRNVKDFAGLGVDLMNPWDGRP